MNGTGKEVYQMPEGDWAFACCGIISDGFATKKEAELAAEVERVREELAKGHTTVELRMPGGNPDASCWR